MKKINVKMAEKESPSLEKGIQSVKIDLPKPVIVRVKKIQEKRYPVKNQEVLERIKTTKQRL